MDCQADDKCKVTEKFVATPGFLNFKARNAIKISEKDALGLFNLPSPTSQICCLATVFPSPGEVDAEISKPAVGLCSRPLGGYGRPVRKHIWEKQQV